MYLVLSVSRSRIFERKVTDSLTKRWVKDDSTKVRPHYNKRKTFTQNPPCPIVLITLDDLKKNHLITLLRQMYNL